MAKRATYESTLQQMRQDLRTMAQELLDATEDKPAHFAVAAVLAINAFSDELGEYELEGCEMPAVGKGVGA